MALTAAPTDIHRVPHDPLATTQDNRFRYSLDTTLGLAQGSLMADQTPYKPHDREKGKGEKGETRSGQLHTHKGAHDAWKRRSCGIRHCHIGEAYVA